MIIGITGTDGSGKGIVVDYFLEKKGFVHCSARAIWEEEIARRGIESTRANMRIVANELRALHGNDFLVTHYLKKIQSEKTHNVVIESIRTIAEITTLKKHGGILLSVDADQKLRFERIVKRVASSDHVTFEQFVTQETLEMDDPDPNGMQKRKVMEMADYTIYNNTSIEDLHKQVDEVLAKIGL